MRKYQRFVFRHKTLLPTITAILAGLYALSMMELDASPWLALLFLPIYVVFLGQGLSASGALLLAAAKPLEEACDPYPLLDETTILLTYAKNKGERALLTLDHAAALMEIGEMDKAYTLLTTLPQNDLANLPGIWFIFYLDLGQCELAVTGDLSRVQVWYEQAVKMVDGIKKPEERVKATAMAQMLYGEWQIARGEYVAALEAVNSVPNNSLRRQVDKAWAYARIAYAQGDIATAVRNLEYVIGYGNRLYVVQQAHALLAEVTAGQNEATK